MSSTPPDSGFITVRIGASFTDVTVSETVATAETVMPSLTVKVNESTPLAWAFGV